MQFFSTCCKALVPHGVRKVVPPSDKWRPLRNLSRVTSCIGVAGVSVAGNSSVSSIRRHGGRGEVGVAEVAASAGAEETSPNHSVIRGVPAGVCSRFTLEDQGRSTTSSSKRRHHMVSGSNSSTIQAAAQPWAQPCKKVGGRRDPYRESSFFMLLEFQYFKPRVGIQKTSHSKT